MKQKIVMKVQMNCQKCRCKAMEIAASAEGVISVAIEGKEEDQVVVVGDGVDSICLTSLMRKKVGPTYLVKVEEVKPKEEKKDVKKDVKKEEKEPPQWRTTTYYYPYPQVVAYEYHEPSPGPACSIM